MKKLYVIGALALVILLFGAVLAYNILAEQYTPEPDVTENLQDADNFTVIDKDGNTVSLSDFNGKPVVVNFWATWCPPCKAELPAFDAMYQKYGDRVQFMMVDLTDGARETLEGAKEFIDENGYTFPVFYDTAIDAANTYNISSVPMTVFITPEGKRMASYRGLMREGILENYIERLLGGK